MPVPFDGPDWLVRVYSQLQVIIDHRLYPWTPLALGADWSHLQACVRGGMTPYASFAEAMTVFYDAVVFSDPMRLLYPGASGASRRRGAGALTRAARGTDEDYRIKVFRDTFAYKDYPDNAPPRCAVCRSATQQPTAGWLPGVVGRSACEACHAKLFGGENQLPTHWMHCINRYGRPIPLEALRAPDDEPHDAPPDEDEADA